MKRHHLSGADLRCKFAGVTSDAISLFAELARRPIIRVVFTSAERAGPPS